MRQDGDLFFDSAQELPAAAARSTRGNQDGKLPVPRATHQLAMRQERRPDSGLRGRFNSQRVRKSIRRAVRLLAREMAKHPAQKCRAFGGVAKVVKTQLENAGPPAQARDQGGLAREFGAGRCGNYRANRVGAKDSWNVTLG